MSADMYVHNGQVCYAGTNPAWFQLGTVFGERVSARQAIETFGLTKEEYKPLYMNINGEMTEVEWGMITRPADNPLGLSIVSEVPMRKTWFAAPFNKIAEYWDAAGLPGIDTAGILNEEKGNRLFLTVQLSEVEVLGEQYIPYLNFFYMLDGRMAHRYGHSMVRTQCQNTFQMALNEGGMLKIRKNSNLLDDLTNWLREAWQNAMERVQTQKHAFETLGSLKMTPALLETALEIAVPIPGLVLVDNKKYDELRNKQHEAAKIRVAREREEVMERYNSTDDKDNYNENSGTGYHFFGAFVRWVDYYKGARTKERGRALDAFVGNGAQRKQILAKWLLEQV